MSADYKYDVYDRRISKVVDADGAGAASAVTTRYVYEDQGITRVVLQFDGSSNFKHRYLHGPAVDQLLADEDSTNTLLWAVADHLGMPRDLINDSGTTQNHLKFFAFGKVTAESASSVDFLMGLAGMDRDEETGNYYTRYRYLGSGEWLSEDPIGFAGNDPNLARYVANSPINSNDPLGLSANSGYVPVFTLFILGPGYPTPVSDAFISTPMPANTPPGNGSRLVGSAFKCIESPLIYVMAEAGATMAQGTEFVFHDVWVGRPKGKKTHWRIAHDQVNETWHDAWEDFKEEWAKGW